MIDINEYNNLPSFTKFIVTDNCGNKHRAVKESSGDAFVFNPRKKRYGHRYSPNYFCQNYTLKVDNEDAKWHKRIHKVIKKLSESGLWSEYLDKFKNLSTMSLDDKKEINRLYWSLPNRINITEEEFKKVFGKYMTIYPFVFPNATTVDTFYIWELSECKLKSMYFGKYRNSRIKAEISDAIRNSRDYRSGRIIVNYDVSFEYNAEKQLAWYSEEYRNCGNGHYYLALDANTAIFSEND